MRATITLRELILAAFLLITWRDIQAQSMVDTFARFDPILIKDIQDGKAFMDYEDIWQIDKNSGRWVMGVFSKRDAYIKYPGFENSDNYLTRSDGIARGRGLVYVYNNTKKKIKSLDHFGFDYFHKEIKGVTKNMIYRVWGVIDQEGDGWTNRYMVGFGGVGTYADNNSAIWQDKSDPNVHMIINRENLPFANEWTTFTLNKDLDVSEYDWIFISFGHAFQLEQEGPINELFGLDNVKVPGVKKKGS